MLFCRRKKKVMAVLALLIGGAGLSACNHSTPEERVDHISKIIAHKLDFNSQQKDLLANLTSELKSDIAEEKNYRVAHKAELQEMILAPELDQKKIKELIMARRQRMDSKIDKYLERIGAIHKSLTSDQKQELVSKLEKMSDRWNGN